MRLAHSFALLTAALVVSSATLAVAANDIMPPPAKAPRTPVEQQPTFRDADYTGNLQVQMQLAARKALVREAARETKKKDTKEFEGRAAALDGEHLRISGKEIRLFGIVTPGLGSSYGPQSRAMLDRLLQGSVLCKVTDTDDSGTPVAFCGTVDVPDISYEMLRQGWAMVDRKAIRDNALQAVYDKVQQEAMGANRGIFVPQQAVAAATPAAQVVSVTDPARSASAALQPAPVVISAPTQAAAPAAATTVAAQASMPRDVTTMADDNAIPPPPMVVANDNARSSTNSGGPGLFERFQTLLAALIVLAAACAYSANGWLHNRQDSRERRRAVAAALRGELMAARHICRTRARELRTRKLTEVEMQRPPAHFWPRIRTSVYQAHVGLLGLLGAELARQTASVYGQFADYAAYYQHASMQRASSATVSETLSIMADHVELVLESLSQVESTGQPFRLSDYGETTINGVAEEVPVDPRPRLQAPTPASAQTLGGNVGHAPPRVSAPPAPRQQQSAPRSEAPRPSSPSNTPPNTPPNTPREAAAAEARRSAAPAARPRQAVRKPEADSDALGDADEHGGSKPTIAA